MGFKFDDKAAYLKAEAEAIQVQREVTRRENEDLWKTFKFLLFLPFLK